MAIYAESDSVCEVDGKRHEHDYQFPVLDSNPEQYFCEKCQKRFSGEFVTPSPPTMGGEVVTESTPTMGG